MKILPIAHLGLDEQGTRKLKSIEQKKKVSTLRLININTYDNYKESSNNIANRPSRVQHPGGSKVRLIFSWYQVHVGTSTTNVFSGRPTTHIEMCRSGTGPNNPNTADPNHNHIILFQN